MMSYDDTIVNVVAYTSVMQQQPRARSRCTQDRLVKICVSPFNNGDKVNLSRFFLGINSGCKAGFRFKGKSRKILDSTTVCVSFVHTWYRLAQ